MFIFTCTSNFCPDWSHTDLLTMLRNIPMFDGANSNELRKTHNTEDQLLNTNQSVVFGRSRSTIQEVSSISS